MELRDLGLGVKGLGVWFSGFGGLAMRSCTSSLVTLSKRFSLNVDTGSRSWDSL